MPFAGHLLFGSKRMGDKSTKASEVPSRKPLKFTPKVPTHKTAKPAITVMKPLNEAENIVDKELLQRLKLSHKGLGRKSAKSPRKLEPMHINRGESTCARSFGVSPGSIDGRKHQDPSIDGSKHQDSSDIVTPLAKNKYVQPWKKDSYYPVTLPLRRSDDIDPEVLDEEEFGEASASSTQDETCIKPAEELGLLEESEKPQMLFFQLPASLPFEKLPALGGRGKEIAGQKSALEKGCGLQELPAGFMGKMMVYKSGIVKMKLGDTLFDVSPGVNCIFPQDVAAINTKEKHCCILGNIDRRVVVTPDLDSLLDGITN
uniref:Uncharacterized protein LOC105049821 isoform X1 n=2 Tax=Elaeis guineensis var. tenera TaxID=51953 RepID=A0A8N4F6F1_ELAGV|nr:uncharacterized protein LOC105049821 isoform X1 [Elaeis guineensis]